MKQLLQILLLPCLLLIGCSSDPVTVVVDKKDLSKGSITIDGDKKYSFRDSVIALQLSAGLHKVSLNGEKPRSFYVGEKGGLLNLDSQAYVAYEIAYVERTSRDKMDMRNVGLKAAILIDSHIVLEKLRISTSPLPDSFFAKYAQKLLAAKNGNYYLPYYGRMQAAYDSNTMVVGLKRFGKGKLFINRFWDYDVDSHIPESVSVEVSSDNSMFKATKEKTAVFREFEFLLIAMSSPDQFWVKSIAGLPVIEEKQPLLGNGTPE